MRAKNIWHDYFIVYIIIYLNYRHVLNLFKKVFFNTCTKYIPEVVLQFFHLAQSFLRSLTTQTDYASSAQL